MIIVRQKDKDEILELLHTEFYSLNLDFHNNDTLTNSTISKKECFKIIQLIQKIKTKEK